tara:strand:- start:1068 stop:1763 length:696 start_codon:yes stop_codon:yes gene_type:complete
MTPLVPLSIKSHADKVTDLIKYQSTTGINLAQAERLRQIVHSDSCGHSCMSWKSLKRQIHDAGYSTIVFPMAEGRSFTRNTKTFAMYWAMCDRGSANFAAKQAILCDEDYKQQSFPIYCYGKLTPQEYYVRDWVEMDMEDVGYVANAKPIKQLLATQTKFSKKSGWGSSAAENWQLWNDDFQREWAKGDMDKILLPNEPLPIKRLKFRYVCLQPETQMYKDAYDKDHSNDS